MPAPETDQAGQTDQADQLRDAFRGVMGQVAATVTVVTATDPTRQHGMTVTAVSSLSMAPPALLVCVNRRTLLHDVMLRGSHFCVNVLTQRQTELSAAFSGAMLPEERFGLGDWETTDAGLRYLASGMANLFCHKTAAFPYGSHTIFVGEVSEVRHGGAEHPLIYRNTQYCRCEPIDLLSA